jgi:hypothetical protein
MSEAHPVTLLSYATPNFYSQQKALNKSAARHGITSFASWTDVNLRNTAFWRENSNVLGVVKRGAGYWLWKPYLICEELDRLENGEFLVYYDVGRQWMPHKISTSLTPLLRWCEEKNGGILPGTYVPEFGPNMNWTKRECFVVMGCDSALYWEHPQIQATFSVWQKSPETTAFASEWLHWCLKPGTIEDEVTRPDLPNFPTFKAHRNDQSIITNLALKRGIRCFGDPHRVLPRAKDINNLVDRIAGRETRIAVRNFTERVMGRIRLVVYTNEAN